MICEVASVNQVDVNVGSSGLVSDSFGKSTGCNEEPFISPTLHGSSEFTYIVRSYRLS